MNWKTKTGDVLSISKLDAIALHLHSAVRGNTKLLPEVLLFEEAHVPEGVPREALKIPGYAGPFTEGRQDRTSNLLTWGLPWMGYGLLAAPFAIEPYNPLSLNG